MQSNAMGYTAYFPPLFYRAADVKYKILFYYPVTRMSTTLWKGLTHLVIFWNAFESNF